MVIHGVVLASARKSAVPVLRRLFRGKRTAQLQRGDLRWLRQMREREGGKKMLAGN